VGEKSSLEKTPEEILAAEAGEAGKAAEVRDVSAEDLADAEDEDSDSDALSAADAREEKIEMDNDAVDSLVNESQEVSDEGVDDGHDRG
jgi:N utilization substance protein A